MTVFLFFRAGESHVFRQFCLSFHVSVKLFEKIKKLDSVYSLSACDGFAVYSELPGCQMGMFPCYSGYKQWTFLQSFTDYIYGRQHSWLISVVVYSPCIEVRSSFDPYKAERESPRF